MKNLIIESLKEIIQSPKTGILITGGAAVNGFVQWFESNISVMSGVVGLFGAIIVIVTTLRRDARQKKEHELDVKSHKLDIKLKEKELNA